MSLVLTPRLQIKQSQKLMMNPQMQQAIQLLQLTNLQLNDMLLREMEQNPFLAFDEADYKASQNSAASSKDTITGDATGDAKGDKEPGIRDTLSVRELSTPPELLGQDGADDQDYISQLAAPEVDLADRVMQQIRLSVLQGEAQRVALDLVGWLDDDGYLRDSDADLCEALACELENLHTAMAIVQTLEPAGIFARDLPHCLSLQLQAQGLWSAAYEGLMANLGLMARGQLDKLASICGVDDATLSQMLSKVQALDPRPAASLDLAETIIRAPDILVREEEAGWRAYLNEDNLPKVLVLERDWEEMAERRMTAKERRFLKSNVQSARWLRKATQQRAATMLRVARAVVEYQEGFFSQGMEAVKPMVLRDIAEKLEVHESTVSRVVASKLLQTPTGIVVMKDLFSTGLSVQKGQGSNLPAASAVSIKARVARFIGAEQAPDILSDEKLMQMLAQDGIIVARRTVAKYREALGIGSSAARRRAAKLRPR
ncbi:RNA polymerase factor sigma-54 [Alphaproteobacteria bacterium]|nr:RNA polymerase factor sigma-54 [Alphaproteobacteria bacterium]